MEVLWTAISLSIASVLAVLVSSWTGAFLIAMVAPPRVQILWLRRFGVETGDAFRVSTVVDRLGRDGMAVMTLQDQYVRLSREQLRRRSALSFWLLFIPAGLVTGWWAVREFEFWWILLVPIGIGLMAVGLAVTIFLIGPVLVRQRSVRNDTHRLRKAIRRVAKGRRVRGAEIFRIPDGEWQSAVRLALSASDAVIIDVSEMTAAIAWEIEQAEAVLGRDAVVFIAREGTATAEPRYAEHTIVYPDRRTASAHTFRRTLLDALYTAASGTGISNAMTRT